MSFLRFFKRPAHAVNRGARPRRGPLLLESLEDRITPSVTLSSGHLFVNGDDGGTADDVIAIDVNNSGGVAATLNGIRFSFAAGQVSSIDVNPGGGISTTSLNATPAGVPINVNFASSAIDDLVTLADARNNLDSLGGKVSIKGNGRNTDTVILADNKNAASAAYTITGNSVNRFRFAGLTYSGIRQLSLIGGSASNTYNVNSTVSGTLCLIDGGSQNDTFNVGTGKLNALAGEVAVLAATGGAADAVRLHDEANSLDGGYDFESASGPGDSSVVSISGAGFHVLVDYAIPVTLNAGAGNDTFFVAALEKSLDSIYNPLALNGGSGNNALVVYDTSASASAGYIVSSGLFSRTGGPTISLSGVQTVSVDGSNQGSTFDVKSIALGNRITVNAGNGVNTVNVGKSGGSLDDLLPGHLSVTGALSGFTTVTLNDQSNPASRSYQLNLNQVFLGLAPLLSFGGIESLVLNGGSGGNSFVILGTPIGLFTTINAGAGGDAINTGSTDFGNVDPIGGPLVINGQGNTTFTLFDQSASTPQTYTLTGTATGENIGRGAGFLASCTNLNSLTVNGGMGGNQFVVAGAPPAPVSLNGGSGVNTLTGPNATTPWMVQEAGTGTLGANVSFNAMTNLAGGSSADTFTFAVAGSIAGTLAGGSGTDRVDFAALAGPVNVNLQTDAASRINAGAAGGFSAIESWTATASADDVLIGFNADTNWVISSSDGGTARNIAFAGFENLIGGTGADVFRFTASGGLHGALSGGTLRQGNWLDYSGLTVPVSVNLQAGVATGVAGKVVNIQDVHAGNGGSTLTGNAQGNILIGGTGADSITGGTGASLLIGDAGADAVTGGSGGDILIGDVATFDAMTTANEKALIEILAEWQSADSYETRFHDINTGALGLNGPFKLNFGITVKDDVAADQVAAAPAAAALDWFFQGAGDTLANVQPGEHINNNTPAAFKDRTVTSPIDEGGQAIVSGTITDPDPRDPFTLVVNWGDGKAAQTYTFPPGSDGKRVSVSHRYADNGIYTIQLSWHDPMGPANNGTLTVTVNNVAPTVDAGGDATLKKGQTFRREGSFTDPGADTWAATVDYGDGAGPQPLKLKSRHFTLQHNYSKAGIYHVVVTVRDADGGVGTASFDIVVR